MKACIGEDALTDLVGLACDIVEEGNAFAWAENNSDKKTRVFDCFDMQRCRVKVMNRISFYHMNADNEGEVVKQAALRKYKAVIDCGIFGLSAQG